MTLDEIESEINNLKTKITPWQVFINQNSRTQFSMGVFFDKDKDFWIVYINDERNYRIRLETKNKKEAFDELLQMVNFEVKNYKAL